MSEIKVNSVVNSTGDNDSGLDLSTNDQVIIKTANTTAVTVDASQNATFANKLNTSNLGTGAVLQTVVHQEDGVTSFTSGTAPADLLLIASNAGDSTSHLSLSITPKFTSSKILLSTSIFFEAGASQHEFCWALHRDSTKLGAPSAGSRRTGIMMTSMGHVDADGNSTPDSVSFSYYDTPNTTSAITYAVSFNHSADSQVVYLNSTGSGVDSIAYERGVSILIAQEIAG